MNRNILNSSESDVDSEIKVNLLLKNAQQKIIQNVENTYNLTRNQLITNVLFGLQMALFMIPYLIRSGGGRNNAMGVMIIMYFTYIVGFQFTRKSPFLHEASKHLVKWKKSENEENNDNFIQGISTYMKKLYDFFFFDKKKKKIQQPYLEKLTPELNESFLISLKNELRLNFFMGFIYILSGIFCFALMYEKTLIPLSIIQFLLLLLTFAVLLHLTMKMNRSIMQWVKGFQEVQSWVQSIELFDNDDENIPMTKNSNSGITEKIYIKGDVNSATIYCPFCGAPDQYFEKYCQDCGKFIPTENNKEVNTN
jgi:hypothetical protein